MSVINCPYQLGDTGPAGGIIVSLPNAGTGSNSYNNTNFYYELTDVDLHTSTSPEAIGGYMGVPPYYPEWGGWGELGAPVTWTDQFTFGYGHTNTADAIAVLGATGGNVDQQGNTTALALVNDYFTIVGGTTYDDWFLPSVLEWQEIGLNINLNGLSASLINLSNGPYWTSTLHHICNHTNHATQYPYATGNPYTAMAYDSVSGYSAPSSGNPISWRVPKNFDLNVRAMRRFECPVPAVVSPCYEIGDIGPAGGIIFSVPNHSHTTIALTNTTNFFYEVMTSDIKASAASYNSAPLTGCAATGTAIQWSSYTGAEFGGKDVVIGTSLMWGEGPNNTNLIDALPSGGSITPPNPVYDVNTIAAEQCNSLIHNTFTDWFLPSAVELGVMISECIGLSGNPANLSTSAGTLSGNTAVTPWYQDEYWSSSEVPGFTGPNSTTQGLSINTTLPIQFRATEKCHTRNVRAVRRFSCTPTPCSGINCIDYNYRDGWYTSPGAFASAGYCTPPFYTNTAHQGCPGNVGQQVTATYPVYGPTSNPPVARGDSVIGRPYLQFYISNYDALGNHYLENDWSDDSIGYTITVWDRNYNFLGQWYYDTYYYESGIVQTSGNYTKYNIATASYSKIYMTDVTHIAGPDPFLVYAAGSNTNPFSNGANYSTSQCYFKIECAATVVNTFAQATNATIWGNVAIPSPNGTYQMPSKCIYHPLGQRSPGIQYTPPGGGQAGYYCFPWYAQVNLDSIVPGTMHPDRATCRNTNVPCGIPCCGSGISVLLNSGGIESSGGEKEIGNFDRGKGDKESTINNLEDLGDSFIPIITEE
tara:strand:- start:3931 stop:6375 length:2445 start_codon:yes stop_codon:yes gene_type:complete